MRTHIFVLYLFMFLFVANDIKYITAFSISVSSILTNSFCVINIAYNIINNTQFTDQWKYSLFTSERSNYLSNKYTWMIKNAINKYCIDTSNAYT